MLPHYSPFKVAEQFRVLDAIAPGRIDLGLGRAPGSDGRTAFALNPLANERGLNIIGPNCLGIINTNSEVRMNAAFGPGMPHKGIMGFISQSGALCSSVLDCLHLGHLQPSLPAPHRSRSSLSSAPHVMHGAPVSRCSPS